MPTAAPLLPPHLQVQDDIGRGVPVGWMVTSSDQAEVLEAFFRALQEGVSGGAGNPRCGAQHAA